MRVRALSLSLVLGVSVVAALPALPASGKQISSAKLKALSNSLNHAKHLTYVATYTSVSDGQTSTVTIAQTPHKSLFQTSGGRVINTGSKTYYCASSGSSGSSGSTGNSGNSGASGTSGSASKGTVQCLSAGGSNPLLGVEQAFSPSAALGAFTEARQGAIARALGIKVSSSSATIGGQPSTCVTVTVHGKTGKYCVTNKGLLSYAGDSSSSYFELTKYSSMPAANLFTLPAGATTVTAPSTPSLP